MGGPLGAVDNAIREMGRAAHRAGDFVGGIGETARREADKAGQAVSDGAEGVASFSQVLSDAAREAAPAADRIDPALGDAARATGNGFSALSDRARNVSDAAVPTAKAIGDDIADSEGVRAIEDVGGAFLHRTGDAAETVSERGVLATALGLEDNPNPIAFTNWLSGPEGPSFEDLTRLVPGLQEATGDVIDWAMENPTVASIVGDKFGFEYVPEGDFYTTNESSMQSHFGFHDAYDKVGKLLAMDLDDKVMEFESGGIEYRVELWKGGYANGGAFGGEMGIYTRGAGDRGPIGDLAESLIPGYYSAANGGNQIAMTQEIYDLETGEPYFRNEGAGADDGKHYWNLAIRTEPGIRHEDIGQRGTFEMNDRATAEALAASINAEGQEMANAGETGVLSAQVEGNSVHFVWE